MKEILEELDKLKAENDTLLSELQGSRFALSKKQNIVAFSKEM
jgi:hypothetical protein